MNLFGISRELHRSSLGGLVVKESACYQRTRGFHPWVRNMPWRKKWVGHDLQNKQQQQKRIAVQGLQPWCVSVCKLPQSCLILCDPMECSPPGSSVHGISQSRLLEWVAMLSSRDLPNPGIEPTSPALQADDSLPLTSSGEPHTSHHMEREREHFHRGEKEARRDLINKVLPWFFIDESLPEKKRCLFSSYWALLLSQGRRASPSGLLTPLNSGFYLLIFSRSWFERKQQRSIKW